MEYLHLRGPIMECYACCLPGMSHQGARSQWNGQFLIFRGQLEDVFVFFVLF